MDREIKFRIWDKFNKKMYFQNEISVGILPEDFYVIENLDGKIIVQPESAILMQYTGLKDKNGKEIYEGDLLKSLTYNEGDIDEVIWEDALSIEPFLYYMQPDDFEVIGNIYENPELLV